MGGLRHPRHHRADGSTQGGSTAAGQTPDEERARGPPAHRVPPRPRAQHAHAARALVAAHPRQALGWFRLGGALADLARYPEALAALRRTLRLRPGAHLDLVHGCFARLHDQRGALRLAERHYRLAIAANPHDASWRILLGSVLARMGRLREATAVHRRATRCKLGARDEAWLNLGLVLRAQERYAEARKCFLRTLRIDPRDKTARHELRDLDHRLELMKAHPSR